jgi:GGDEF domain-containing protein
MEMCFSVEEGRVLHGLLEDASGDIVVRLDPAGFIVHASQNAAELGMDLSSLLLMPHIADFAEADHVAEVARHVAQVFAGQARRGWVEFPVRICTDRCVNNDSNNIENQICTAAECQRWYALSLKPIEPDDGAAQGAIGLLRSVQQKHALEGEINIRAQTDPRTGLANRHTFYACLRRGINEGREQAMAVLAVDSLRAVLMQYGQRTADEIQWGFAKFLETMTVSGAGVGHELAQLDGERFAVLLPGMSVKQARVWTQDVLETFSGLTVTPSRRTPELTASAGLAPVEITVDWTMRQAELGLVMARAGGGMQVGVCGRPARAVASGAAVERAMGEAVRRAEQRQV